MKVFRFAIPMLVLILSVGAVCATNTTSDDILSDGDVALGPSQYGTLTDLKNNLSEAGNVFEITGNYRFNNESDSHSGVLLDKDNFMINGNNHILDGSHESSIFNITGNGITINDLIFINGNSSRGGALYVSGNVTLNNVVFINNTAARNGGAIYCGGRIELNNATFANNSASVYGGAVGVVDGGFFNCSNSRFIDNNAIDNFASSLYAYMGEINICNVSFTSRIFSKYGPVCTRNSNLTIYNSTFVNITSSGASALWLMSSNALVSNSKFINLTANSTAGAIAVRLDGNLRIENCEFTNTKSFKNAGAVNVDFWDKSSNVTVSDSLFRNSCSDFGGAFVQLSGNLFMNNTRFSDNFASYSGGAVYISYTNAEINNCTFDSNAVGMIGDYPTYGGALYCDKSNLTLSDSRFTNNSAGFGNAIYAYDASYNITGSVFQNNTVAIFTYFDGKCVLDNNVYGDDEISTNNTCYSTMVSCEGIELNLINNIINVTNLPSRFDLREYGWVSSVKNQGYKGFCWSFGALSALESALLKSTGVEYDFSEDNIGNNGIKYGKYGSALIKEGGFMEFAWDLMLSWLGPVAEGIDEYDDLSKLSLIFDSANKVHVQDVLLIPVVKDNNHIVTNQTNYLIKQALLKYGAVTFYYDSNGEYFNGNSTSIYHNDSYLSNHGVVVVGWDDEYSKDNFRISPPGDGAWLIKNNWGSEWGDDGYAYISYFDTSLLGDDDEFGIGEWMCAFIFENTKNYTKNYQTDFIGLGNFTENYTYYSNEFEAVSDDLLAAVGTYFNDSGVEYELKIYVNDELRTTQSGVSEFSGFRTIVLDRYVQVKAGDKFKAVFKSNNLPYQENSRMHYVRGMSLVSADGISWKDITLENKTICLKVYTVADDSKVINNENIAVDYAGGKYFSVKVVTADGNAVAGASVKFTINGKTSPVKTDSNGIAKIKITQTPGKYTIKTACNGKTYTNKVTVNHVLKATKVTVKKTSKKLTLKATLKINGKLQRGKLVVFKFAGKTYKVKTNSKGIAQKTLTKKVIKNLKKGKTYTVKVTYLKDTIKTTVKVK